MFKGLITVEMAPNSNEVATVVQAINLPALRSWRAIANPFSQYMWQAKPPGVWVVLLRFDEFLVTTSDAVPLDVDYAGVFDSLKAHKGALLARVDSTVGLIGIAIKTGTSEFMPWMPGLSIDETVLAQMSEEPEVPSFEIPEGLLPPAIIKVDLPTDLHTAGLRKDLLRLSPGGVWLMAGRAPLIIYEVLA